MAAVNPVLLDPVAQRLVAEPELAGDLVDRPARRPYQRDRVTLELRAVLGWTSHPSPLPLDLVQCRGVHPPGGTSKRRGRRPDSARPRPHAPARAVRRPWLPGRGPAARASRLVDRRSGRAVATLPWLAIVADIRHRREAAGQRHARNSRHPHGRRHPGRSSIDDLAGATAYSLGPCRIREHAAMRTQGTVLISELAVAKLCGVHVATAGRWHRLGIGYQARPAPPTASPSSGPVRRNHGPLPRACVQSLHVNAVNARGGRARGTGGAAPRSRRPPRPRRP